MHLGFHISIAGGISQVLHRAVQRRCTTLQMFTSSPVQWQRPLLAPDECKQFAEKLAARNIGPHFVHAVYLLNIASPDRQLWQRSVDHLAEELRRAELLAAAGVVLHLGSGGAGGSVNDAINRVARALNVAREQAETSLPLILENSAGAGNTVGSTIPQIAGIVGQSQYPEHLQICLDTAHAFAAGWPLHHREGLDKVLEELDTTFGPQRLVLIHANDSRAAFASRVDRHWHIGQGKIGREGFRAIVNHPRLRDMPFIMETPGTEADDLRNMRVIRRLINKEIRPSLPPAGL